MRAYPSVCTCCDPQKAAISKCGSERDVRCRDYPFNILGCSNFKEDRSRIACLVNECILFKCLLSTPMGVDYVVIGFDMGVQPLVTHNAA